MSHPRRRSTDRPVGRLHRTVSWLIRSPAVSKAWLGIITIIMLLAVVRLSDTETAVQKGRRFAITATCAVESAVAQAGRHVIMQSASPPAEGQQLAAEYVRFIAQAIQKAEREVAPGRPARLIRADGTIDCKKLLSLADASVS